MKYLAINQRDGSVWGVPVSVIARNRAEHYAHEFGGDVERSLAEDTIPLFEEDWWNAQDWAANNMNWSDVSAHAVKINNAPPPDFQEAWWNGMMGIVDIHPITLQECQREP